MADLNETDDFPEGVYQLEDSDPVKGGAPNEATKAGVDNIPHLQLARRTRWLKTRVDTLVSLVVAASTTVAGIVRLTDSVTSSSVTTAATANAAKAANDNAETRALKTTTIDTAGLASGGGNLSANRTITVSDATQAEAEAGTATNRAMSPLRVAQAIAYRMGLRSIAAAGLATGGGDLSANRTITVPAATQAQAEAGTDNATAMTPLRVAQAILAGAGLASLISVYGYLRLPGGLLIQWGMTPNVDPTTGVVTFSFPIAFTVAPWVILPGERTLSTAPVASICNIGVSYDLLTAAQCTIRMVRSDGSVQPGDGAYYLAIGR